MLDPLTVTTTIITLATFIKDLIELGEGIRSSIEKVGENRRQIRDLTQDIVRTLYDLASLTSGKEGAFRGPELLVALESLKAEMLYVHSKCLKISPKQLPGLRSISSHLKAWRKRDDLEKKIARLRERANKCLLEFNAFSAARTEHVALEIAHTALRIEQRLIVDNIENQLKARRLEGLMAPLMLETEFGQHKLRETVERISARPWSTLGCFGGAGMYSEVIVWDHLTIDLFGYMATRGRNLGTFKLHYIASTWGQMSRAHRHQSQLDAAIECSQQSLALWVEIAHLLPEADNRIGYLQSMIIHAKNLVAKKDKTAMLSAAQDAVSLARPMAKALAESIVLRGTPLTIQERQDTCTFCDAFLVLAKVLSSLDRPLDSYEAFLEAFQNSCSLPISSYDPLYWRRYIDSFLNVICTVAEDDHLSLSMLAGCVGLFRNLARIYPEQCSSGFLRVLHVFAYFSQQPHSYHSMEQIRLFLEPSCHAGPPAIDIATSIPVDSDVLADAMRLFFADAWQNSTIPLIQNILVAHFHEAIEAFRVVVHKPVFDKVGLSWILPIACKAFSHLSRADCVILLRVLVEAVKSSHAVCDTWTFEEWEKRLAAYFRRICNHVARFGFVNEGISICQEIVTYLEFRADAHPRAVMWLQEFQELCAFLLCDAARFSDAVDLVKRKRSRILESGDLLPDSNSWYPVLSMMKAHILQRVGRLKEALQLMRMGVADTLERAEKAVMACREIDLEDTDEEEVLCVQIHSLTTHSNCLATVGRPADGLASAQNAVSLYTEYSESMWRYFIFPIRSQELGGNAFLALSLRLLSTDDKEEALSNGRRATELYRELVALAPSHLPTLARSLRHLASVLWLLGHEDEATTASEEAADILRKVVDPETYFLPIFADALDELAGYLTKRGDYSGASGAITEAAAARLTFASLPPGPEWLFEQPKEADSECRLDSASIRVEVDDSGADESEVESDAGYEDALETIVLLDDQVQPVVAETREDPCRSSAFTSSGDDTDKSSISELDVLNVGGIGTAITRGAAEGSDNNAFLSKQVEISLRLSMRSTTMDVLWWILLLLPAFLFAVMYARLVQGL
ncbi:Tetratricopeptide repeat family [Favolaschia claudopus]|uniref:Tetratricopeptide repeat family n=1 Tax=Favolaschia claudopus TaxID=2862362 RepID=A0AAW0AZP4_9AGAR